MLPNIKNSLLLLLPAQATIVAGACPKNYIFAARETSPSLTYGSTYPLVEMIYKAHPDIASETIGYWACTGDPSCHGMSYAESVQRGINAVVNQVHKYHESCPDTQLILVGFGQGGQIMDNALCGGGDPTLGITNVTVPISDSAVRMIKAAIFFGNFRAQHGLPYQVGSCRSGGIDPRSPTFVCPNADKIQSYCDSPDAYCCTGNSLSAIQGYTGAHGQEAVDFTSSKLASNNTKCATKRRRVGAKDGLKQLAASREPLVK